MNDREKIVALFINCDGVIPAYSYTYEEIADHLMSNCGAKMEETDSRGSEAAPE